MSARLDWTQDGADWPNHGASRFVRAGGLGWHVQRMGAGEKTLLLHGTGASTHSWGQIARLFAETRDVLAPDLPGHGFSDPLTRKNLSLPGMAAATGALCRKLDFSPEVVIGHSAGAAVAIRMTLDGSIAPRAIVSLNGALLPIWTGVSAPLFASAAKFFATTPIAPWLFARRARDPASVDRLLRGTGSNIPDEETRIYRRLAASPGHVAGALGMMAGWDLKAFARDLARLKTPLLLFAGTADGMVPASSADEAGSVAPNARVIRLAGLGHLAHEEAPERVRAAIEEALAALGAGAAEAPGAPIRRAAHG